MIFNWKLISLSNWRRVCACATAIAACHNDKSEIKHLRRLQYYTSDGRKSGHTHGYSAIEHIYFNVFMNTHTYSLTFISATCLSCWFVRPSVRWPPQNTQHVVDFTFVIVFGLLSCLFMPRKTHVNISVRRFTRATPQTLNQTRPDICYLSKAMNGLVEGRIEKETNKQGKKKNWANKHKKRYICINYLGLLTCNKSNNSRAFAYLI